MKEQNLRQFTSKERTVLLGNVGKKINWYEITIIILNEKIV